MHLVSNENAIFCLYLSSPEIFANIRENQIHTSRESRRLTKGTILREAYHHLVYINGLDVSMMKDERVTKGRRRPHKSTSVWSLTMKRLPKMHTDAKVIIGDSQNMHELSNESVQLVVTSPPYFNAPFDYPDLFKSYDEFLQMMTNSAKEVRRVVSSGRIVALVVDDTLIEGKKYPVVADITKIFVEKGFKYRERITWVKPEGYIRISKRSGVILQHPYPMYYYPDNLQESILIFQKGDFNYKSVPSRIKELSTIDKREFQENKWYLSVWRITNVLPNNNRLEKGIAAFPEEIPYRLIKLFSYWGETVLDPFLGSGTTMKVANELQRNSAGYEIDMELKEIIKAKLSIDDSKFIVRRDCKRLRTQLQSRIKREVAKNG